MSRIMLGVPNIYIAEHDQAGRTRLELLGDKCPDFP